MKIIPNFLKHYTKHYNSYKEAQIAKHIGLSEHYYYAPCQVKVILKCYVKTIMLILNFKEES